MPMNRRPRRLAIASSVAVAVALAATPLGPPAMGASKTTKSNTKSGRSTTATKRSVPPSAAAASATAASASASASRPTATTGVPTSAPPTTRAARALGRRSDTLYEGKNGFKVDLSKCPRDWDPMQGITQNEVRAFVSLPRSGPLAGFGLVADGMNSYFRYVNEQGGVAGRRIVLDVRDDLYEPARTKANVSDAIGSRKYAALVATLGTANNLAVWDDTNKECMPQLLTASGAAQWGDVDGHPWTTGMQIDYTTESILWSEWIKSQFPRGAKVAMLTMNNDFGRSYSRGFRTITKGSSTTIAREELHDPTAPTLTNHMTNIEAVLPDVILLQTTGVACTQAMAEIEKRQYKGKVLMSQTCNSLSQFFQPLIDQGLTGDGTYLVQTWKDVNDAEFKDDPAVKLFRATAKAQGLDPDQSTYATGWIFAWFFTEIVREAATYEGGLNRANLMLAARGIERTNPFALAGITTKMGGMEDAYLVEGGRMAQYKVRDPKQLGTYVSAGEVVNKEGTVGTYRRFNSIAEG